MPALFLGLNRALKGRTFDLPTREGMAIPLGSAKTLPIIFDDPDVAKHHARLTVTAAGHQIEDLAGAAGVALNDQPLAGPTLLKDGDEVRLGTHLVRYFTGADAAAHAADAKADLATHDPISRLPTGDPPADAAILRPAAWRDVLEQRGAIVGLQCQRELGRRLAAARQGGDQLTSIDGWSFAISPADRAADLAEAVSAEPFVVDGGTVALALIVEQREP
jgi:hypothetical protein